MALDTSVMPIMLSSQRIKLSSKTPHPVGHPMAQSMETLNTKDGRMEATCQTLPIELEELQESGLHTERNPNKYILHDALGSGDEGYFIKTS